MAYGSPPIVPDDLYRVEKKMWLSWVDKGEVFIVPVGLQGLGMMDGICKLHEGQ